MQYSFGDWDPYSHGFEHETRKILFIGMYNAFHRLRWLGRRRNFDKTIQKLLYAEIVQCTAKNTGLNFPPNNPHRQKDCKRH